MPSNRKRTVKPQHRPVIVRVHIYRLSVIVVIAWTLDQIIEFGRKGKVSKDSFTDRWKKWVEGAMANSNGFCTGLGDKNADVLIWLKTLPTKASEYGTLWHELVHAVDRIANHCDRRSHFDDDEKHSEPRAFLYEYLAVEITKGLWNRKIKK